MGFWKDLGNAVTGAVTGGLGGLVSSGINGLFGSIFGSDSERSAAQQTEANKEQALWNYQNITKPVFQMENAEWNRRFKEQNSEWERQWNMQNEYNTPAEQMQRMREAGLNPALMQGNFDSEAAAPGAVGNPSVNEAASAMAQPTSVFEAQMNEARIQQMQMQNRLTAREVEEKTINNKTLAELNAGRVELQNVTITQTKALTENTKANTKLTYTQRRKEKALIKQVNEQTGNIIKQRDVMDQEINESKRRITESYYRQENLEAQTGKINADKYYQEIVNKYAEQNQQWLIRNAKAQFGLTNAQAQQAYEYAKQILQGTTEAKWAFQRRKDQWNAVGQWDLSFEGARAQANWKGTPMQIQTDDAARQWQACYNTYMAGMWMASGVLERWQRGRSWMENSGKALEPNATPSYQTSTTY